MNSIAQTVLREFLSEYLKQLEKREVREVNPFFKNFFTRKELVKIITSMFGDIPSEMYEPKNMEINSQGLLEIIHDDSYILNYFLKKWDNQIQLNQKITSVTVWEILKQLGLQAHYLGQKPIALWDTYDHSNYINLQLKSGNITRVYGIYSSSVEQGDVYEVDSQPNRFYETEIKANRALAELINQGTFKKDEIHILWMYKGI